MKPCGAWRVRPEGHLDEDVEKVELESTPEIDWEMDSIKQEVKPPKRCQFETCKCKLGLVAYPCRCSKYFCSEHRFSDDHKCSYNFKEDQKKTLLKYMSSPVISAKVEVL